jgi:hypothetical protein
MFYMFVLLCWVPILASIFLLFMEKISRLIRRLYGLILFVYGDNISSHQEALWSDIVRYSHRWEDTPGSIWATSMQFGL